MCSNAGGHTLWFADNGSGRLHPAPAGRLSTLVHTRGTYTRTLKDGTAVNLVGRLTSPRRGHQRQTRHVRLHGSNQLRSGNGQVTTYAYSSGKLATITDPRQPRDHARYTSGKLTGITDPTGAAWGYAYDGSG